MEIEINDFNENNFDLSHLIRQPGVPQDLTENLDIEGKTNRGSYLNGR